MSDSVKLSGSPLDFVVVGGQRCGTGWLAQCLREHPQITMHPDESRHLFDDDYPENESCSPNSDDAGGRNTKIGEKCANYLTSDKALDLISKAMNSKPIVICVRNPVERYRSARLMRKRMQTGEFVVDEFCSEDFERGLFGAYCERYLARMGSANVLIVFYEDMMNDPERYIKNIFNFLDIRNDITPESLFARTKPGAIENSYPRFAKLSFVLLHRKSPVRLLYSRLRRLVEKPKIYTLFERELLGKYLEDISLLEELTGRDLRNWKLPQT